MKNNKHIVMVIARICVHGFVKNGAPALKHAAVLRVVYDF